MYEDYKNVTSKLCLGINNILTNNTSSKVPAFILLLHTDPHACQVLTAVLLNSQVVNDVMLCLGLCLHCQGQMDQENIFFPALLEPEDKGTTVLPTIHNYDPIDTA